MNRPREERRARRGLDAISLGLAASLAACGGHDGPGSTSSAAFAAKSAASSSPSAVAAPPSSARVASPEPPSLTPRDPLSPDALLGEVSYLASSAFEGRGSATPDEAAAARHLGDAFDAAGLEPVGEAKVRTQTFDADRQAAAVADPARPSHNVMGLVRAPHARSSSVVVLGAHYDHLGRRGASVYFGADDDASGTSVVLGVARSLMKRRAELDRDVVVVLFGSEEIGLRGSRAFVERGPLGKERMFAMVNVDMVGRPLADQPLLRAAQRVVGIDPDASVGVDGLHGRAGFERLVRAACEAEGHRAVTVDDLPASVRPMVLELSQNRGDNASFEAKGVPAIFFSSAESSDYHEVTDTVDTLSPELLVVRARIIERTVIGLTKLDAP